MRNKIKSDEGRNKTLLENKRYRNRGPPMPWETRIKTPTAPYVLLNG